MKDLDKSTGEAKSAQPGRIERKRQRGVGAGASSLSFESQELHQESQIAKLDVLDMQKHL